MINIKRLRVRSVHFYVLFIFIFFSTLKSFTQAEPWIENRFAQNCASCHSPSRRNLEAKDRRCTLACQGCHVNPNGGGIRNQYGVWNQQRWLRSYKSEMLKSKGTPAPLKYQKYANMPKNMPQSGPEAKKWQEMAKHGPPLVVVGGVDYNEKNYDKSDRQEHINVGDQVEFLARLTEDDPWREERKQSVFAGGDFRYFFLDYDKDKATGVDTSYDGLLAMGFDVGVRVKPATHNFSLVFEHRYFQGPNLVKDQSSPEKVFEAGSQVRSAYAMVDDLPYATYVMYGLYRPQFGHMNPDHTTLLNTIMYADNANATFDSYPATSAKAVHKALTIGGSPNVPFANIHMIMPTDLPVGGNPFSQDKGFAVSAGGRFVSYGASFMVSWWSTKGPRNNAGPDLKNDMLSVTGGGTFKDFIANVDFTTVERESAPGASDRGTVTTYELKYRFWREMYGVFNYASSNVARNLAAGDATETMVGAKFFLVPGSEFEILMINREDNTTDPDPAITNRKTDTKSLQAQMHLFF